MRRLAVAVALAVAALLPAGAQAATGVRFGDAAPAADRAAVRAAVAAGRLSARRLLRQSGAAIDVEVTTHREPASVSMMRTRRDRLVLDFSRTHLRGMTRSVRNQTVWHEIGHVVDLLALRPDADAAFAAAFARGARYRSCFRYAGDCLDRAELFAEQFAYWATGDRRVQSSYEIPPLIGPRAFSALIVAHVDTRPPWWLG